MGQEITKLPLMETFSTKFEEETTNLEPPLLTKGLLIEFAQADHEESHHLDKFYQEIIKIPLFLNQGILIFRKIK